MLKIPDKIVFANLPTKIEKLDRLSKKLNGPNIYIKRDDETGFEVSGNKIRKLEYSFKEAIDQGCDLFITCGGIQSNHCRAVTSFAARLGLKTVLVLNGPEDSDTEGNLFIDKLLGADIYYVTDEEFKNERGKIMESLKAEYEAKGFKPYLIPVGASNGIGGFGYYEAMLEIAEQEKELDINFDHIVLSVGSGGTYAGLFLASKILKHAANIYGINITGNVEYFQNEIYKIVHESLGYLDTQLEFGKDDIKIIDGYVGGGYAISSPEEREFIKDFARLEGILLDPVYTGKGMFGLVQEIANGRFKKNENVLFIHTGGAFGLFAYKDKFDL